MDMGNLSLPLLYAWWPYFKLGTAGLLKFPIAIMQQTAGRLVVHFGFVNRNMEVNDNCSAMVTFYSDRGVLYLGCWLSHYSSSHIICNATE